MGGEDIPNLDQQKSIVMMPLQGEIGKFSCPLSVCQYSSRNLCREIDSRRRVLIQIARALTAQ